MYHLLAATILLFCVGLYVKYQRPPFLYLDQIRPIARFRQKRIERKISKDMDKAIVFLQRIDILLRKAKWSRQRRRQFWRDLIKHPQLRANLYDLIKES